MKNAFIIPCSVAAVLSIAAADTVDTHQSLAQALTELLSATEAQLNTCRDAETVTAALPELQRLAATAADLAQRSRKLPDPTVQDMMAAQQYAADFNQLSQSIDKHIERLRKEGLMTEELSRILGR